MEDNRFAQVSRFSAAIILLVLVAVIAFGLLHGSTPLPATNPGEESGNDERLYAAIVNRLRSGESYYEAAAQELRARGYATRPFLNWRLPTLAFTLAFLPSNFGRILLGTLALAAFVVWTIALRRSFGRRQGLLAALLLCGSIPIALSGPALFFHETWAGLLIAFSLGVYGLGWRWLSVCTGILALFVRELSLPYIAVMALLAWHDGRRQEMYGWLAGLFAFFAFLGMHASTVATLLGPADRANLSWLQLGGWPFILSTARWNVLFLLTPVAVAAILWPLMLVGLAGWRGPLGNRVGTTVGCFVVGFSIAGRPDNFYWGLMYSALVPLGLLFSSRSLSVLYSRLKHGAEA